MLGISHDKLSVLVVILGCVFSSLSTAAYGSGDLLIDEQWALDSLKPNSSDTTTTTTTTTTTSENTSIGTCASNPVINGDTYSCESFTSPGKDGIDINVYNAWDIVPDSEQEVVIGLIDTGIDYLHPDLKHKVWRNPGEMLLIDGNTNGIDDGCEDGIDLDDNGYLDDCHGINTIVSRTLNDGSLNAAAGDPIDSFTGHGTNMAGVIGAVGDNSDGSFHGGIVGVTGFHDNIRILTCAAAELQTDAYVTIPGLPGAYGTHDDILECFNYFIAMKERGVNIVVVNGSGGASRLNNLNNIIIPVGQVRDKYQLDTPDIQHAVGRMAALDVNLVVAAGNNRWDIDSHPDRAYYPAAFRQDNIIAVGAINNQGDPWKYTSYGRWSVDVFAPGERILSTSPRSEISGPESSEYVVSDGSSQATAFVSGMIALARTYPETAQLDSSALRRLLISSGKPLASITGKSVSGKMARLIDSNNGGMLNCQDQVFERRHWPQQQAVQVLPGDWFQLEVASYVCDRPGGRDYIVAEVTPSQQTFLLTDDGIFPDKVPRDGIFTGRWQAQSNSDLYQVHWGKDTTTGLPDSVAIHTAIVVDNRDSSTQRSGSWWSTIFRPGFYSSNYRVAFASGDRTFTWKPEVSRAGYYEVLAHWPDYSGFTSHAEYSIYHGNSADMEMTTTIADQSQNGRQWNSLGVFWFEAGAFPVELSNSNINGAVAADAIKLRAVAPTTQSADD